MGQLLQEHLLEAGQQLNRFAAPSTERQREASQLLLPSFSDVYSLDEDLKVLAVLKTSAGSRVFTGFTFAGSHLNRYLQQKPAKGTDSSTIDRGVEHERASVYFASITGNGKRLLARLSLSNLQTFLSRQDESTGLLLQTTRLLLFDRMPSHQQDFIHRIQTSHALSFRTRHSWAPDC